MRKLLLLAAFATVVLFAGNAMAQSACQGDPNDLDNPSACAPCLSPDSEPGGTSGCIELCGDQGCICAGGDATTGAGCVGAHDASGAGVFVCGPAGAPAQCDFAQCQAAAQAACEAAAP